MQLKQIPVEGVKAGLYEWTMVSSTLSCSGHVVVRGPSAGPIGNFNFPAGTETWYWQTTTGVGGTPSFTLKLALERSPTDATLLSAVTQVVNSEQSAGTCDMVPPWQQGAPLPSSGDMLTLTNVANGVGSYTQLYKHVSFYMPVGGSPVLPTWYTDIAGLYSVFGGNPNTGAPIQEGIVATMTKVKSGNAGYPDRTKWSWYGRHP